MNNKKVIIIGVILLGICGILALCCVIGALLFRPAPPYIDQYPNLPAITPSANPASFPTSTSSPININTPDTSNWLTYNNKTNNIRFKYPTDWVIQESYQEGNKNKLSSISIMPKRFVNGFRAYTITIEFYQQLPNTTPESYRGDITDTNMDFTLNINGETHNFVYAYTAEGNPSDDGTNWYDNFWGYWLTDLNSHTKLAINLASENLSTKQDSKLISETKATETEIQTGKAIIATLEF